MAEHGEAVRAPVSVSVDPRLWDLVREHPGFELQRRRSGIVLICTRGGGRLKLGTNVGKLTPDMLARSRKFVAARSA